MKYRIKVKFYKIYIIIIPNYEKFLKTIVLIRYTRNPGKSREF